MGIWDRLKAAFNGNNFAEAPAEPAPTLPAGHSTEPAPKSPLPEPSPHEPADKIAYGQAARNAFYAREKARAKATGVSVKSYRAGYVSAETAKEQLVPGQDGRPPLHLVSSDNGLDLALTDGRLVDYKTLSLRRFNIFAFRVVGMSFYEDPGKPRRFRNGQQLGILREPHNEHDPNAVALTAGRPAMKIGYVNKQRAKWVSELLDAGHELTAIIIQTKASSPRALITTPDMLDYLRS